MTINLEELVALDAVGALDAEERRAFERALADAPASLRAEAAELREVAARLAGLTPPAEPPPAVVRERLLSRVAGEPPATPPGFTFRLASDGGWVALPVPGLRMKVLSMNRDRGYATLLLDVAPGSRFPAHHHSGPEECYVISGSVFASGRRLSAGDFLHADADSDHDELWSDEGCRVLLVVSPQDYFPDSRRG